MNAIEFSSQTHDGVIDLPQEFAAWNGKKVRVILLEEEPKDQRESTPGVHDEIEILLKSPLRISDATPLAREEIYERQGFIDTNIWFYAFVRGNSAEETSKNDRAKKLIKDCSNIVISIQVINELSVNLLKKATYSESRP